MMRVDKPAHTDEFAMALRDRRRASGLTQEALAERAGISPRSVSAFESASGITPRRDTVVLLARALGLRGADRAAFESLIARRERPARTICALSTIARQLDRFFGREHELCELGRMVGVAPLITLVGAGGIGKTRLAEELVRQHGASFAFGTVSVDIAELSEEAQVESAVATAFGLRDLETVIDELRARRALLVLDGCERHLEACAKLAMQLLRACPNLYILATSREPLGVDGEVTRLVEPLELPEPRVPLSLSQVAQSAAVRLFIDRASAVDQAFELTDDNVAAVVRVCHAVDAIPLAVELAASRMRLLTIEQLAERLPRDGRLLSSSNRRGPARHRSMYASIEWSHDVLSEPERLLLRRLSVFDRWWTLEMAEDVCPGNGLERSDVVDLLGQLITRSLVLMTAHDGTSCYRLLEAVRHYALERLIAAGEADDYVDVNLVDIATLRRVA